MEKKNYIPTFIIAYLLCIGGLNQIMGILLRRSDGVMIINLIPVAALCLLHFFISNKNRDLNLDKKALLFVYYAVSVIVVYKYAFRYSSIPYREFLVYTFIPIYLSFYKIDTKRLLEFMMFFSLLVLPVSDQFFKNVGTGYDTIGMSTTYNALPFVIAAALHCWYYRKGAGIIMKLSYGINIYYLVKIIILGNRGPIISLAVLGILLILNKFDSSGFKKKNAFKTAAIYVFLGFITIYMINNIEDILYLVDKWLKSMNVEVSAISKSIKKLEQGDLTNGRETLFAFVKNGIKEHYLIGNGIGTLLRNSGYRYIYPHNIFLQLWYDTGIIVSVPMFWMIWKATKKTAFESLISKDCATVLILVFTLSIPRLCYSSEFWTNTPFWLLMMLTISPNLYQSQNKNSALVEKEE